MSVLLNLRVTQSVKVKPSGTKSVTFQDEYACCAPFTANPRGVIVGGKPLSACLGLDSGLAAGNIEILGAQVVSGDWTGCTCAAGSGSCLPLATSGITR